jgi:hypothetical protein
LIEKAFEYADDAEEFADNLNQIYDRTGVEIFKFVSDTLHPQHRQQVDAASMGGGNRTVMGSAVGGSVGANVGTLAGLATGKEKGAQVGGAAGGLIGGGAGALIGHKMPQRPPSLAHLPPPTAAKPVGVGKSVGTQNRSGSTGQRQEAYTNHYLQQATQMMAPQVAQHIQQLQQQQMMQQMMEQQMLQNAPQQQNWQTLSQMGPQGQGQRPMQQGQQGPSGPVTYQQ